MKLSIDEILLINALEKLVGVNAKDCIVDGQLVSFLVRDIDMGKAIGKKASNIKKLQEKLNKRIEFIPLHEKAEDVFAKALEIDYVTARKTNHKLIVLLDAQNKAKAYCNNSRIKRVKELIKRNYGLELVVN